MKPYTETKNGNIIRRTFSDNVPESELVWHRDHEDRVVLPLNENDWMVQFDNELPTKLVMGEEYFIPKNVYHRVIKGSGELQVEIIETNFDEIIEEGEKKGKRDACYHKVRARYDVWPSAYACVPENTSKALTRDGWKYVDELSVGDEIMTYNIEKDELEFKPILNLHRYKDVKTNVVKSGNNGFIFEATDNHKWVVKLPEIKGARLEKYNRINDKALIETSDLLANKNNKHLVVSAQYNGGENIKIDKIFKYGTNWVKYILDITSEQRQSWLFSAIVYDGNQKKVERLTENTNNVDELNWLYTGPHGKQSFGFKQKDIEHRDAFLLSAFLNSGLVTWKKVKDKDIYACHYSSNKNLKNTSNFKLVKENIADVWCPETENETWVMLQETDGNGIITVTGNSGALVKCRKVGAANWGNKSNEGEEPIEEKWSDDYKKSIDCKNPKGFSQKAHCDARKKRQRGEETKSKPINENVSEISRIVNQYIKDTEYDIQNSLGNCSFFTRDVINWAKNNGVKADYVYMPMSEEYRKENNISDNEWEDHIVPMINGIIIDFAYTPQGVSKFVRTSNTIPPRVFKYSDNLFKPNGIYGKFGYTKPEINTEYGNPKNINSFGVVEPNKKKENLDELTVYNPKTQIKEKLDLLKEISADDAYNNFYKNMFNKDNPELDRKIYDTILKLDPTFKEGKIGQYSKWLFRSDNLKKILNTKDEDLYKIYDDLKFFNNAKIKNILPSDKRDINKFDIRTLLDFVFSFSKDGEELMSNKDKERELKKDTKKYNLTNWTVIIPETEEASCYYGKGTKWCTAADKYNNAFDSHNNQGPLYILINKEDPSEKFQFHFETSQFMDVKDDPINLGEFMQDNDDVYEFFSKIKGNDLDYEIALSCIKNYDFEGFEDFYSRSFTDEQKKALLKAAFDVDDNSSDYHMVSMILHQIDYEGLEKDFRDEFIWGLERTLSYNKYDDEHYNARMFIDYLGGFNEDNIDDIIKATDLNEIEEINALFEIAEQYDALKLLAKYLEDENIDINFDFINVLDNIKKKFKSDDYENSYESDLVIIRVRSYDIQDGTLNVEITPKDENGNLLTDKTERGNINYKSMINYLTSPSLFSESKKTDFSKEKSKGLHGWFERQGGKGKSKGWVDCNTCKKDPKTGRKKCKSCGRQEGEKRKYPACRPTPSACGTRGKGKKWGKKSTNENLNISENFSIFEKNYIKMKLQETFNHEEPLVLPAEPKTKPKESPMIQPSRRNKPFLPERETQPDPKAEN